MINKLKILIVSCLPHHFLSGIMYKLTRSRKLPFLKKIMQWYVRHFQINLSEAKSEKLTDYQTMNTFFTRALKADARYFDPAANLICSPADGGISQFGPIVDNRIFQAKNHEYSLQALLGGLEHSCRNFINGQFITIYLSPSDYHRVHMPYAGQLREVIHIPGRLFSVAPDYVEQVPQLFARNERVVSIFDTEIGTMAVILVGAIFVSSIETVWSGVVVPPKAQRIVATDYTNSHKKINLSKGEEMGRFNMGSTVIVLLANPTLKWNSKLAVQAPIKMGHVIAELDIKQNQQ